LERPEGTEPTAICNPWGQEPADMNTTTSSAGYPLPANVNEVFVFKNAERAAIQYCANTPGDAYGYNWYGSDPITDAPPGPTWSISLLETDIEIPLHIPYGVSAQDDVTYLWSPHGEMVMAGSEDGTPADGLHYFWHEAAEVITFAGDGVSLSIGDQFLFYATFMNEQGIRPGAIKGNAVANGALEWTTGAMTVEESGYYAWSVKASQDTDALNIQQATFTGETSCMGHRALPYYSDNAYAVLSNRVNAATLLYSNVSSLLDLEGIIYMAQMKKGQPWQLLYSDPSSIQGFDGMAHELAKDGMYGFVKPTDNSEFVFKSYTTVRQGEVLDSFYPIKPDGPYLACVSFIDDPDGRASVLTFGYGFEYTTQDVWRDRGFSLALTGSTVGALEVLATMPQFQKNDTHIAKIWDGIKSGISGAAKATSDIASIAKLIGSLV
jgi:hypothetical protein